MVEAGSFADTLILGILFAIPAGLLLLLIWAQFANALPHNIPMQNATNILNDTVSFVGVLIGFTSVVAGLNVSEIYKLQEPKSSSKIDFASFLTSSDELDRRKASIILDFMIIGVFTYNIFSALVLLANLTGPIENYKVSGIFLVTLVGITLMLYRFYSAALKRF